MRDIGIPKLLAWRWTPFAALVLGSLSFVGFVTLAVPDKIGGALEGASTSSLRLGNHFSRTQPTHSTAAESSPEFSSSDDSGSSAPPPPSPATQVATLAPREYPKRGFSPPLERPEPEPPPPPPPAVVATMVPPPQPPQPVLAVPPQQEAPPPQPVAVQPDNPPSNPPSADAPPVN
jgi:hypothetical protein